MPTFLSLKDWNEWLSINSQKTNLWGRWLQSTGFCRESVGQPSVNIVLTTFPMLLQIDSLGIVSAAGKASFKPVHADILLKWDTNALGKNGIVR